MIVYKHWSGEGRGDKRRGHRVIDKEMLCWRVCGDKRRGHRVIGKERLGRNIGGEVSECVKTREEDTGLSIRRGWFSKAADAGQGTRGVQSAVSAECRECSIAWREYRR